MLVLIGATPEGKKELLGLQVGMRESAQSWRELLMLCHTQRGYWAFRSACENECYHNLTREHPACTVRV